MPKKLRRLKFDRVDLVDDGANLDKDSGEGAHILLYKRAAEKAEKVEHESAKDFDQTMMDQKMRDMYSRMYDCVAALQESLGSILSDSALSAQEKREIAQGSMDQFSGELLSRMDELMAEREPLAG